MHPRTSSMPVLAAASSSSARDRLASTARRLSIAAAATSASTSRAASARPCSSASARIRSASRPASASDDARGVGAFTLGLRIERGTHGDRVVARGPGDALGVGPGGFDDRLGLVLGGGEQFGRALAGLDVQPVAEHPGLDQDALALGGGLGAEAVRLGAQSVRFLVRVQRDAQRLGLGGAAHAGQRDVVGLGERRLDRTPRPARRGARSGRRGPRLRRVAREFDDVGARRPRPQGARPGRDRRASRRLIDRAAAAASGRHRPATPTADWSAGFSRRFSSDSTCEMARRSSCAGGSLGPEESHSPGTSGPLPTPTSDPAVQISSDGNHIAKLARH